MLGLPDWESSPEEVDDDDDDDDDNDLERLFWITSRRAYLGITF
jgi:hypothetical protein